MKNMNENNQIVHHPICHGVRAWRYFLASKKITELISDRSFHQTQNQIENLLDPIINRGTHDEPASGRCPFLLYLSLPPLPTSDRRCHCSRPPLCPDCSPAPRSPFNPSAAAILSLPPLLLLLFPLMFFPVISPL